MYKLSFITMTGVRLQDIVVYVVCWVISVEISGANLTMKTNDNTALPSNVCDIHIEMQCGRGSFNFKSTIDDNMKLPIEGLESVAIENISQENQIVARSTIKDIAKSNVESLLNNVVDKFQTIQNSFKHIESENNKACGNAEKLSTGVKYDRSKLLASKKFPKNCAEVQENGNNVTGIYEIYQRNASQPFAVLCDMEIMGGGWTLIQKRFDGSQDFDLGWRDYKFGFGHLDGEFWLGLEKTYLMTNSEPMELLIEIVDRDNVSAFADYSLFMIGPEKNGYTLDVLLSFSGDAGDSLTYHLGQKFSTHDLDFTKNCATLYPGAWWYQNCFHSNLNGKYINIDLPEKYKYKGLHWKTYKSLEYCHSKSRMMIRPTLYWLGIT